MDARSNCRPKVQAGSLAHAEKPPVRGGKLPAPAGGWALPAAAPALHEQMCISRLLRKSRQYLHSVERRRGGPSRALPRLLRAALPVGRAAEPRAALLEQGLGEGTALPVLCPPGAAAKKPVFQKNCFPRQTAPLQSGFPLRHVLPQPQHPCAKGQVGS